MAVLCSSSQQPDAEHGFPSALQHLWSCHKGHVAPPPIPHTIIPSAGPLRAMSVVLCTGNNRRKCCIKRNHSGMNLELCRTVHDKSKTTQCRTVTKDGHLVRSFFPFFHGCNNNRPSPVWSLFIFSLPFKSVSRSDNYFLWNVKAMIFYWTEGASNDILLDCGCKQWYSTGLWVQAMIFYWTVGASNDILLDCGCKQWYSTGLWVQAKLFCWRMRWTRRRFECGPREKGKKLLKKFFKQRKSSYFP